MYSEKTSYVYEGDIILLKNGMCVEYAAIPEYYYNNYHPYSPKTVSGHLNVGEPKKRRSHEGELRKQTREMITFWYKFNNIPLSEKLLNAFMEKSMPVLGDQPFAIPPGQYQVIKREKYMEGFIIYCQNVELPQVKVHFHQSVNRISNHNEVEVVKRANST